jgi:O-antigen/teichoic acid export membrane protein
LITRYIHLLKQHLSIPLYKNAYYLIANYGLVALLGFIFWIVAAKLCDPHDVGLGSAIISGMLLLASISTLGMGFGLIRFLPSAGLKANRMINASLTLSSLVALLVGVVFLAGLDIWSPNLILKYLLPNATPSSLL